MTPCHSGQADRQAGIRAVGSLDAVLKGQGLPRVIAALVRAWEGDAEAFALTCVYEVLEAEGYSHEKIVKALSNTHYTNDFSEALKDRSALDTGLAATQAVKGYLSKKNRFRLASYDKTWLDHFRQRTQPGAILDKAQYDKFITGFNRLRSMPFMREDGTMVERLHYLEGIDTDADLLALPHMSQANRLSLEWRERSYSLTRKFLAAGAVTLAGVTYLTNAGLDQVNAFWGRDVELRKGLDVIETGNPDIIRVKFDSFGVREDTGSGRDAAVLRKAYSRNLVVEYDGYYQKKVCITNDYSYRNTLTADKFTINDPVAQAFLKAVAPEMHNDVRQQLEAKAAADNKTNAGFSLTVQEICGDFRVALSKTAPDVLWKSIYVRADQRAHGHKGQFSEELGKLVQANYPPETWTGNKPKMLVIAPQK